MGDEEIKLTTSNNTTCSGETFPTTPNPEVLTEHFASIEPETNKSNNDSEN